jgi:hypothetical protein
MTFWQRLREDINLVFDRDPAARSVLEIHHRVSRHSRSGLSPSQPCALEPRAEVAGAVFFRP